LKKELVENLANCLEFDTEAVDNPVRVISADWSREERK
jgi:hypothetical protein